MRFYVVRDPSLPPVRVTVEPLGDEPIPSPPPPPVERVQGLIVELSETDVANLLALSADATLYAEWPENLPINPVEAILDAIRRRPGAYLRGVTVAVPEPPAEPTGEGEVP